MTAQYNSDLYPRNVIIKTAYSLTDKYYVHLDYYDMKYIITLTSKSSADNDLEMKNELDNLILSYLARFIVSSKTSRIRQLIMARAFSSSMITNQNDLPEYNADELSSAEDILKDWFECDEG